MGVVYRGERVGLAKPVAIKFLHRSSALVPEYRKRFEREAVALSRLTHPNLVSIIDYGTADAVPYLVMDFYPGQTLRALLKTGGALAPTRAVFIMRQILAGLHSAHEAGVVHRDLKPANVLMVGSPGEDLVKIVDFGIAKLVEGDRPGEPSVVGGVMLGTAEYTAPEQALGKAIDRRCDVYAAGIMLYEMVTGRRPFEGQGDLAVLRAQVEDAPQPPRAHLPALSAELEALILRALEKKPEQRWATATAMAAALALTPEGRAGTHPARSGGSSGRGRGGRRRAARPTLRATTPPPPSSRWSRRLVMAIVLLALGGAAAAGWYAVDRGLIELRWPDWLPR
jgi:serine/threonine-protein kinase